jgi:hypothetical protein
VSELEVGMKVHKLSGYEFDSTVVAVFTKLDGEERVVCELDEIPGLLHIFSPAQVRERQHR